MRSGMTTAKVLADRATCKVAASGISRRRQAGLVLCGVVMLAIGTAGGLKFLNVHDFAASLTSWSLIPASVIPVLSIVLPATELTLGLAWFTRVRQRECAIACMILLTAFTTLYVGHLLLGAAPDCACLGTLMRFEANRNHATWIIGRNLVLLTILFVGLAMQQVQQK